MLFILCSPDLRGGRYVLTRRLIIRFTCVICKHDGIIGRVNMDVIRVLILLFFYLSLTRIDVCLDTVQIANASRKVKEKQAHCRICLV